MRTYPCYEKKRHWNDYQSCGENTGDHSNTVIVSKILNDQDSEDDDYDAP
jgi:hypothetical protein